jgi:hypothetical protein
LAEQRITSAWSVRLYSFEKQLNCCEELVVVVVVVTTTTTTTTIIRPIQWPCGLRRGSAATRLPELWFRSLPRV